jgi:hypothetical protein
MQTTSSDYELILRHPTTWWIIEKRQPEGTEQRIGLKAGGQNGRSHC